MSPRILPGLVALLLGTAQAATSGEEKLRMERVDEYALLNLPVRGFEALSLNDKVLAYHLYQSAVVGRDIHFDQNHRHNLAIKSLCEEILLHPKGISKPVLDDIAHYLKKIYINAGIHGKMTFAKFTPPKRLTFDLLSSAAKKAEKNGAKWVGNLASLRATIFDPDFDSFNTSRSPKKGEDVLTASTGNYYDRGIRMADLENFKEVYPLNSRVVRKDGTLTEEVWRAGDSKKGIPSGIYGEKLAEVIRHIEAGIPFAHSSNVKALRKLIDFYRTGDNALFDEFNIAWLRYDRPVIDTINGFIEEYRDPRERKGAWEGQVFFVSESTSGWLREVARKADAYEKNAPYSEEYKRTGVKPIANMVEVLVATGDGGPILWSGVNLPNKQEVRQEYGSKNVLLWNGRRAKEEVGGINMIREFIAPEDQDLVLRHSDAAIEVLVGFHEALGHASGQKSSGMKGDPKEHLPVYYSWLEEERADLLALHHAWDPMTSKIRPDWSDEAAKSLYKRYPTMELMNLSEVPEAADAIEEPHAVGGNFAVRYLMKKWKAIEEVRRVVRGERKTFWVVRDENIPKMRQGVAELLRELQRIKSEGDLAAIKKLAEEYGATVFDKKLAAEIRSRKKKLKLPSYYAFVFPTLDLIEKVGKPLDVKLGYPENFLRQQLSWSGYSAEELKGLPKGM